LSFLPFCAKAPTETISPIRAATKIDRKYFIYLTASSRLSGSLEGEAESLRALWFSNIGAKLAGLRQINSNWLARLYFAGLIGSRDACEIRRSSGLLPVSRTFSEKANHLVHEYYLRTMTLTLPTLLLLSYARNDIVCSPAPTIGKSTENRSR
jgi:hypothetical protein